MVVIVVLVSRSWHPLLAPGARGLVALRGLALAYRHTDVQLLGREERSGGRSARSHASTHASTPTHPHTPIHISTQLRELFVEKHPLTTANALLAMRSVITSSS